MFFRFIRVFEYNHFYRKKCFHFVNEIEIKKFMQGLNSKKATGTPKLIKVAVDFLTPV